jgi:hypothetical protein
MEQINNAGRTLDAVTVREAERSNSSRTLDVITAEIQQIERRNVFEIGALLVEAQKVCDHGDWLPWLEREFEWSQATAYNYMNAHHLAEKFQHVGNLAVPMTIIYGLAEEVDEHTGPIIDALVEATASGKRLSVSGAEDVIRTAWRRIKYGDYPEAAQEAMAGVDGELWGADAIAALKAAQPTTAEEARAIVERVWQAYEASRGGADDAGADDAGADDAGADAGGDAGADDADDAGADDADDADDAADDAGGDAGAAPAHPSGNQRAAFLMNCRTVTQAARYEGPVDDAVVRACRRVADAFTALADKLERDVAPAEAAA